MKPRNANEREALAVSKKIPTITPAQERYAYKHCFKHKAIRRGKKHEYICLECGHTFKTDNPEYDTNVSNVECPNCHKQLDVEVSLRRRKERDLQTFQIVTARGGYQIVRTFHVWQYTTPKKPAVYGMSEVVRVFMKPGCHDVIIAKPRYYSYIVDAFRYDSDMTVRYRSRTYGNNLYYDPYRIWATVVYPRQSIIPLLKRNGYNKELSSYDPVITISRLLTNPHYETLAKANRMDIWKGLEQCYIDSLWPQVQMLIRHKYYPTDFGIWKDTISMANRCGYDTHSPKYVLPADINQMHDFVLRKDTERVNRERLVFNKKEDKKYRKAYGKLLEVCIKVDDLTITPLKSYIEFEQEGKAMHHCVANYFGHRECLILSVKQDGKRIATVELSMEDFSVKQCRAAFNKVPPRYDEICSIINANTAVFRRAQGQA